MFLLWLVALKEEEEEEYPSLQWRILFRFSLILLLNLNPCAVTNSIFIPLFSFPISSPIFILQNLFPIHLSQVSDSINMLYFFHLWTNYSLFLLILFSGFFSDCSPNPNPILLSLISSRISIFWICMLLYWQCSRILAEIL